MKYFFLLFLAISLNTVAQDNEEIKAKAEKAIVSWANKTFNHFEGSRFENFHLSPSPEYYAMSILREEYETFKEEIVYNFNEGTSDRTEQEVKDDTANIDKKIEELDAMLAMIDPPFDHIEYFWWSNIQTDNGLTVYFQHQIKLNPDYKVISYRESSAVGKPSDVKILYK
jgi:hypothetical protein